MPIYKKGGDRIDADSIKQIVATDNLAEFYDSSSWRELRRQALDQDNNECQTCKHSGKYTKANTVHHVNHVKDSPELALAMHYTDDTGAEHRNLVSLCHECHQKAHDYNAEPVRTLTVEKW